MNTLYLETNQGIIKRERGGVHVRERKTERKSFFNNTNLMAIVLRIFRLFTKFESVSVS